MASALMHLYIGNKFVEKHGKIADLPQFYLGCILPDWGGIKENRWLSHIRSKNINEWYENNIAFYRCNVGNINNDLLLGYIIHNITDAAYDEFFNIQTRDYRFDYDQRNETWWTNEVLPELKKAVSIDINRINKSLTTTHNIKIEVTMPNIERNRYAVELKTSEKPHCKREIIDSP